MFTCYVMQNFDMQVTIFVLLRWIAAKIAHLNNFNLKFRVKEDMMPDLFQIVTI